jgi:hypothetical protein
MYAVEFETNVTSRFIELKDFEQFMNRHVKVIVLADEVETVSQSDSPHPANGYDFTRYKVKAFRNTDGVAYQRALRNEWE